MRIVEQQVCIAEVLQFSVTVVSTSKGREGTEYTVSGVIREGNVECSCPGFQYRGTCKHVTTEIVQCGWTSQKGGQSDEQERERVCPRCGSRTVRGMRRA